MRVWLVDFDGKFPNLALMRLSTYHKARGDVIELRRGWASPELWGLPDKLYVSCLFAWNRERVRKYAESWAGIPCELGGTGFDISVKLPGHIESAAPDYTLYNETRAIGFISRGCIRKCPWCVVPEKEGNLRRVSTATQIVGDKEKAIFLDNNFLALPDHNGDLQWLAERGIPIDFNQGLDARLVTPENAMWMAKCEWIPQGPRFALDSEAQYKALVRTFNLLTSAGVSSNSITVFVLIGFSGFVSDVTRLLQAHELGARVFPMGYRNLLTGHEPMRGWKTSLYRKYKRLITRLPHARSVWDDVATACHVKVPDATSPHRDGANEGRGNAPVGGVR